MPCTAFEERLIAYDELGPDERKAVNAHLSHCQDCGSFLSALADLDSSLSATLSKAAVSAGFSTSVMQKLRRPAFQRPSVVPEVLDAIGWAGVVAILLWLIAFFVPDSEFTVPLASAIGTAVLIAGFWVAYRCYGDLRRC
jgi:anti-sigma factor RsiW